MFSVILPTLQHSSALGALLELCPPSGGGGSADQQRARRIDRASPDGASVEPGNNLFVNPSWNLGAREAQCQYLIISNDDITFSRRVIDAAARALRWPIGIIGPDPSAFTRCDSPPRFSPAYRRTWGFGSSCSSEREATRPFRRVFGFGTVTTICSTIKRIAICTSEELASRRA